MTKRNASTRKLTGKSAAKLRQPNGPSTTCRSDGTATTESAKLSDEQLNAIVKLLIRSPSFWWKMSLGLVLLACISYFGLTKATYQRIEGTVSTLQSNAVATLSQKVESATRLLEFQASNRLIAVDVSLSNINLQANQRLDQIEGVLREFTTNANDRIDTAYQEITNRVSRQMTERITEEFKDARIKQTVAEVASSHAKQMMVSEVAPILTSFVHELNASKAVAATNIAQVELIANFALQILRAQNDESSAFDELVKLRDNGAEPFKTIAMKAVEEITMKLAYESSTRGITMDVWRDTTNNSANANLSDYRTRYQQLPATLRMFLIHEVYTQNKFSKFERMQFLAEAGKVEPSLRCRNQICYSFNGFLQTNFNLLGLPLHEKWWNENEAKLRNEHEKESKAVRAKPAEETVK